MTNDVRFYYDGAGRAVRQRLPPVDLLPHRVGSRVTARVMGRVYRGTRVAINQ